MATESVIVDHIICLVEKVGRLAAILIRFTAYCDDLDLAVGEALLFMLAHLMGE